MEKKQCDISLAKSSKTDKEEHASVVDEDAAAVDAIMLEVNVAPDDLSSLPESGVEMGSIEAPVKTSDLVESSDPIRR